MGSILAILALLAPAHAQVRTHDPAGPWRTVDLGTHRFHYPLEAEPWALLAASQAAEIHARVVAEVGYVPPETVDVVVMDPFRLSNGFALPFLWGPRMGLFATPPDADPPFGHYRSWAEELLVHEDAHLVHLLRPSRNPAIRLIAEAWTGTTWLSANSPAWVIEGYATVVEGRLTGLGRPNSDFRALFLRKLAQEGRLPTYGQLEGSDRWMGGSFRYLVGSAYLEWLEARTKPGALRDLWARMSAREVRSFDEAFEGVFRDDPATLYGRFCAEITLAAMEMERDRPADEGTLWLDLSRNVGSPALSPDGSKIALVRRPQTGLPRISVYATADDPEEVDEWQKRIEKMLKADPQDVAPLRPEVFPREPEQERVHVSRMPGDPRWTRDGQALLFPAWVRDSGGFLRPDLFRWEPTSGREDRITRGADIVDVDPHPDGTWAIAVRSNWGSQHLVRIDLATGDWTAITEPDPHVMLDDPRFSADGSRVVYLRHDAGWHLIVRDVASGAETEVALPEGAHVSGPAWAPDGTLVASVGLGGYVDLWRIPLEGAPTPITHAAGGAAYPAPTPDGQAMFYLSMDGEGLDVHRLALSAALPASEAPASAVPPVVRPPPPPPVSVPVESATAPHRYGIGRWEGSPLAGFSASPGAGTVEVGLRLGDVIGRSELLVLGGVGLTSGWNGLSVAYGYHGLPVDITAHLYAVDTAKPVPARRAGGALVLDHAGVVGAMGWGATAGVLADVPWGADPDPSRVFGFAGAEAAPRLGQRTTWLGIHGKARVRGGQTGEATWVASEGSARGAAGIGMVSLGVEAGGGRSTAASDVDRYRLGGTDTSMVPDAYLWSRSLVPGIAPTAATGEAFASERAFVQAALVEAFLQRDLLYPDCSGFASCGDPLVSLLAGVQADGTVPFQGLARTATMHGFAGVACAIEDPTQGPPEGAPCLSWNDWRAWAGITWRP